MLDTTYYDSSSDTYRPRVETISHADVVEAIDMLLFRLDCDHIAGTEVDNFTYTVVEVTEVTR